MNSKIQYESCQIGFLKLYETSFDNRNIEFGLEV